MMHTIKILFKPTVDNISIVMTRN